MFDSSIDFKEKMAETRRTQILIGAAQVFSQKGFHKATTKEIASAAGISEGTIYNYFKSKRDLLLAMVDMFATRTLKKELFESPPEDPRIFFKLLFEDRYQLLRENGHVLASIVAEVVADESLRQAIYHHIFIPIAKPIEQYIQAQMATGRFRSVNPVVVTRALVGAMMLTTTLKLTGLEGRLKEIPPSEMIDQILDVWFNGLDQSHQKR